MALVNEYTFDTQTGTSLEDRIGTNNGTLAGATLPTWGTELDLSKKRNKLGFTGGNGEPLGDRQRVEFTRSDFEYNSADSFSFACLFKTSSTVAQNQYLFSLGDKWASGLIYNNITFYKTTAHAFRIILVDNAVGNQLVITSATSVYNDGNWHCAALKYDATTETGYLYIDNVLIGSQQVTAMSGGDFFRTGAKFTLGALWNTTNYQFDYNGDIAYFANYNHALSTDEIKRITEEQLLKVYTRQSGATYAYLPPKNNVREDLKLYMPLNGSSNDYSGNDITVTNTGVSFEPVAPDGVQVGNFNGSSNKIKLPTGFLGSNISEFSYGGWFKVDSVASDKQLFEIASVTSDVYLGARIESTTQAIDFACVQTPATTLTVSTSTTIETDKWYHIAVSAKQNDFIKIYLNGVLEDSTAITVFADIGGSYSEYIGVSRTGSTKYFDGNMRGHKFFTKVLTPTEIDKLYRDTYIS